MLELMPDGETFKKLTKAQHTALDRYYKRQRPSLLDETTAPLIANGLPIIVGTAIGAIAYVFRDQLADEAKDFAGGVGKFVNEGIWSSLIFPVLDPLWQDPKTPEMVLLNPEANPRDYQYAGPLTRCQRWETDIVDIESKNGGGIDRAFVLRKMKNEGCSKPAFVDAGEWGRV
jgi:hypothetical protein